jgi:D-alanine transfer protein
LTKSPLLEFALERLASGRLFDRLIFCAIWPIGKMQTAVIDLQDHFAALNYILRESKSAPLRHPEMLDWSKLIAEAGERKAADKEQMIPRWRETGFLAFLNDAPEWMDLELLLRALAKIHARPLLLSMPMAGEFYDQAGVSRSAREAYYKKIHAFAQRYNFALVEFEGHDDDPAFLDQKHTHLTAKGWMFYNRALDDFFHDRPPES